MPLFPLLTSTSLSYNLGMAETFSFIPVQGANRHLFAKTLYNVNATSDSTIYNGTPLTPLLTSTPGDPPSYNLGMAETFSYIPIQGAGRPLFAKAIFVVF